MQNNLDIISLVCATKGRPARMKTLLEQIYNTQTSVQFETLIVTSCAADDPGFVHTRHRVIQEEAPGAVQAAELGIKHARGRWVWLLNDDISIENGRWLDEAWAARFEGLVSSKDVIQGSFAPIVPFPFFCREWYLKNLYPTPYKRYCQDMEIFEKAILAEEIRVYRIPHTLLRHHHDPSTVDHELNNVEKAICQKRIAGYKASRPPIVGVITYRQHGSPRPMVIKRMVEQLRPLKSDFVVLLCDDHSSCPEQLAYLESVHGLDGRFYVKFNEDTVGPNGQHQKLFNLLSGYRTQKWILLDDDLVITQPEWVPPVLEAMDKYPHLYIKAKTAHPHPHGFFMTGTHDLLQKIGGYDLKTFPFRYGDTHADFTLRAMRAGLAAEFDLKIDFQASQPHTANGNAQAEFIRQRGPYDKILEDVARVFVPPDNCQLKWIRSHS